MTTADPSGPVIASTAVDAGHDGRAELVVELAHPNGVRSTLTVDEETIGALLDATGATSVDDLVGRSWIDITAPTPHV